MQSRGEFSKNKHPLMRQEIRVLRVAVTCFRTVKTVHVTSALITLRLDAAETAWTSGQVIEAELRCRRADVSAFEGIIRPEILVAVADGCTASNLEPRSNCIRGEAEARFEEIAGPLSQAFGPRLSKTLFEPDGDRGKDILKDDDRTSAEGVVEVSNESEW